MLAYTSVLSLILYFGITLPVSATVRTNPGPYHPNPIPTSRKIAYRLLDQSIDQPRLDVCGFRIVHIYKAMAPRLDSRACSHA